LQQIRDEETWEEWLLFMINGIRVTSRETIELIAQIKALMQEFKIKPVIE
jgi:hypothetical protein